MRTPCRIWYDATDYRVKIETFQGDYITGTAAIPTLDGIAATEADEHLQSLYDILTDTIDAIFNYLN